MEEKIETTIIKLNFQKQVCLDALNEYSTNHPSELVPFEKEKIETLLKRMFIAEKEFLCENPDDYFEIYGDED